MVTAVFFAFMMFISFKTKCVFKIVSLPFLFQVVTILYLRINTEASVSIFFILLFSLIDFSIYFLIKRYYRNKNYMLNNQINSTHFNLEEELIEKIIGLKDFGYIDFKTKQTIIYMQLLIILLSIGELYV